MEASMLQTDGWRSERDVTNQCAECLWMVRERRLVACDYARPEFPSATHCPKFCEGTEGDE
jgi:hypothetical protein